MHKTLIILDPRNFNFWVGVFCHMPHFIFFIFILDITRFLDLQNVPGRNFIVKKIISKLKRIRTWFLHQKRIKFYSSSILIAFDGEKYQYPSGTISSGSDVIYGKSDVICKGKDVISSDDDVIVRMIDFPHTYIDLTGEKSLDANYIYGLENLVRIFENLESRYE